MYDHFEDSAYDGGFDRSKWNRWDNPSIGKVVQQAGNLMITQSGQPGAVTGLAASKYTDFILDKPIFFEAKLMLDPNKHGEGHVHLSLQTTLSSGKPWWSACQIADSSFYAFDGGRAATTCNDTVYESDESTNESTNNYESTPRLVDYGSWHTMRIEIEPATMASTYYIDGQVIGLHVPVDAEQLKNSKFTFHVSVWGALSNAVVGYIDDVRIGQIAN